MGQLIQNGKHKKLRNEKNSGVPPVFVELSQSSIWMYGYELISFVR
jgi:hypothetical protein